MYIIALDASTKATGVAIFKNKELLGADCLTASSTDLYKRIHKITDGIDKILSHLSQMEVTELVMEEVIPDHTKNTNTFKALMYLQASIMMMIHDNHPTVNITLVYPGSWRSKCGVKTGRGVKRETLKEADIRLANETFGLNTTSDDIADAVLIGAAHINYFNISADPKDNEINWE